MNVRYLLLPFSWIYGGIIRLRHFLYDHRIIKSSAFDFPVIVVGNLEVGGAGKSPMTEYLISLLKNKYKIATLSRGYGRKTKGFFYADKNSTTALVGDEPLQFKRKFPQVTVAVCENRVAGVEKLKIENEVILLDDAYQHRALMAGFNILLFDYQQLLKPVFLLPAGNYRDIFRAKKRADILVISKCQQDLPLQKQHRIIQQLGSDNRQSVFFTTIRYQQLQPFNKAANAVFINPNTTVYLLTGIANPKPLLQHLRKQFMAVVAYNYPDHHQFTNKNISKLVADFKSCSAEKKIVITTEKDAQRLQIPALSRQLAGVPVFTAPITIDFLNGEAQQFGQLILDYVRKY